MKTISYLLIADGKEKIPVEIMWWTEGRYCVKLSKNCSRGLKGENVHVTAKEIEKIEQKTFLNDPTFQQLDLF